MDSLINEDGDIDDTLVQKPPVWWAKDPLNLAADECEVRLLHVQIKYRAAVPSNPSFEALSRDNPPRAFQLRLRERFTHAKPTPLSFFKLFFGDEIIDIFDQNTNAKALVEEARTGRQWKPVDRYDIST
jgi:hypothetical protein